MESFWAACGARGPLVLEVEEEGDQSRATRHSFDRPTVLIGSGPRSDLRLAHPEVSRRHAYLQMIAGHPFCVDLDSRTGTVLEGGTATGGWVVPGRPIQIGPSRVWVRSGPSEGVGGPPFGLNPLSVRGAGMVPGPPTMLIVEGGNNPKPIAIRRTLTLIGRSGRCKIRLSSPATSRFHGALLRTPDGLWAIDLRSSGTVSVNGARLGHARIEDGDELAVGPLVVRVSHPGMPAGRPAMRSAGAMPAVLGPIAPGAVDLRPLLEQVAGIQHQSSDQFGQVVLMLTQMFGNMHREMVDLVREELEQIRRLAAEMQALRADPPGGSRARAALPGASPDRAPGEPTSPDGPDSGGPTRPRDPGEVHLIVSERLAAFERERQGRWSKISKILLKTAP